MKGFLEEYGEFVVVFLFAMPIILGFIAFFRYAINFI